MTVSGIIGGALLSLIIVVIMFLIFCYFHDESILITAGSVVLGLVLLAAIWCGLVWYYNSTASGARAVKTQQSEFSKGLEREIRIYDIEGDLIETYSGKLDVEYDDDRILFDDENGKRHIIYYGQDTVLIDEK